MNPYIPYIIDGVILVILLYCIGTGTAKGFTGTVIRFIGYIAAIAIASALCGILAEKVYDNFIHPSVMNVIQNKIDSVEYNVEEQIADSLEEKGYALEGFNYNNVINGDYSSEENSELTKNDINDTLTDVFKKYYQLIGESLSDALPDDIADDIKNYIDEKKPSDEFFSLNDQKNKAAEYIETKIVRPVVLKAVRVITFGIIFTVVMIAVRIIARTAGIVKKIPIVGGVDRFFGGVLGLVQALLILTVATAIIIVITNFTDNSFNFINSTVISDTILFKYLYNIVINILS